MFSAASDGGIFGDLYGSAEMRAIFSDEQSVQRMLDVEAALAAAQARLGLIPEAAARAIAAAALVARCDLQRLAASTRTVGYPIVDLVKQLGAAAGASAAPYVHLGATTQDILDTALVLQMRAGLAIVERDLAGILRGLVEQARSGRELVMAGRTHLQHAVPITFGYKAAVWAAPLIDHVRALRVLRERIALVQFGGAAGTLAALGTRGREVTQALAAELGLRAPDAPWHATREPLVEAVALLALVCGSLAKIATDVALLMQTEVAEAREPYEPGRGSSSTMPQKRNPIAGEYVIAATRGVHALLPLLYGAMIGDHERSTGPWQSERIAIGQAFVLCSGALAHSLRIAHGLSVDAARMRHNLDLGGGLILAEAVAGELAGAMGAGPAHAAIERACNVAIATQRPLFAVLAADSEIAAHLDAGALARLAEPANYLGEAHAVVDRVTAAAERTLSAS